MFPIEKRYQRRFRVSGNPYYEKLQRILDNNEREIVKSCQAYLHNYELKGRPKYAVDIDRILALMERRDASESDGSTKDIQ